MASPTVEEYLEAIYSLQAEGSPVIGARVAERMGVSPPTMTTTLQRMVRDGYIEMNQRKEILLTDKGNEVAESLVRRHRLSERWLVDVLGLDWSKAHQEACRLEHALSTEVEQKLAQALDYPSTCPHGNPIPGSPCRLDRPAVTLDRVSPGHKVIVTRVAPLAEVDPSLLDYLQRHGLLPGAEFTVLENSPSAGVVVLVRGDAQISVGLQAILTVWVDVIDQ